MSAPETASRTWIERYFKHCGDKDIDAAMEYWAPSGELRFGNEEPLIGRDAIAAKFREIVGLWAKETHTVLKHWELPDGHVIVELSVHFLRHDGHEATVRGVTICRVDGQRFLEQRTCLDLAPVFAPVLSTSEA